jgi:signal peptidase I
VLISKLVDVSTIEKSTLVKFANVDRQLIFQVGKEELTYDLGLLPDPEALKNNIKPPVVQIVGFGELAVSHLAIFRDIYYTSESPHSNRHARAVQGNPFTLDKDEFFVLGDNSPNSEDGRWWARPDSASKGCQPPRAGIVPRDYLVGKAMFVYWPSGFEFPWPESLKIRLLSSSRKNLLIRAIYGIASLRWIPNVGEMRFVYGGSNKED